MKKFFIVDLIMRTEWGFDTAQEASIFMWGKDTRDYAIFVRVDNLPSNIDEMKIDLHWIALGCTNP